jgi:hypothetical protein
MRRERPNPPQPLTSAETVLVTGKLFGDGRAAVRDALGRFGTPPALGRSGMRVALREALGGASPRLGVTTCGLL